MADAMLSSGLAAPGGPWEGAIMHIEECIVPRGARDPVTHVLQPNATRWPNGLASLAEYFHSKNLRAGVYTDVAAVTCAGFEGSGPGSGDPVGHWPLDAQTFAEWGFDMIEADFCNAEGDTQTLYTNARDAIAAATAATGRRMTYYVCSWGDSATWQWSGAVANLARNTGDICSPGSIAFEDILANFGNTIANSGTPGQAPGLPGTGVGAWNDPDALGVGLPGITDVEGRTQFSLWVVLGAPLILSADVRNMSAATFATVSNAEAVAINQQSTPQGVRVFSPSGPPPAPSPPYICFANISYCRDFGTSWALNSTTGQLALLQGPNWMVPTGLCAAPAGCSDAVGTPVLVAECASPSGTCAAPGWRINSTNGNVTFRNACLIGVDPATSPANQLVLGACDGSAGAAGVWSLEYTGRLGLAPGTFGEKHPCVGALAPQDLDMFMRMMENGDVALALLNRGRSAVGAQSIDLAALGYAPAQRVYVRDVWAATTLGPVSGAFATRPIDSHETILMRLSLSPI